MSLQHIHCHPRLSEAVPLTLIRKLLKVPLKQWRNAHCTPLSARLRAPTQVGGGPTNSVKYISDTSVS